MTPQGEQWTWYDALGKKVEDLSREMIGQIVSDKQNAVKFCYEKMLRKEPTLQGKLSVHFTIGSQGSVVEAHTKDSTFNNAELEQCVITALKSWRFPSPKDGKPVSVRCPWIFRPAD